jgi:hypothetical protein
MLGVDYNYARRAQYPQRLIRENPRIFRVIRGSAVAVLVLFENSRPTPYASAVPERLFVLLPHPVAFPE